MTTPTPDQPPLWRAMHDAFLSDMLSGAEGRQGFAREILAIADEMVMQFDPWLAEHAAVADWLKAEAQRAERGDG